jgi:UDP-N-acetylmuramate--alanine ligase
MTFEHIKSVYFIGIGGIGMSALARYFHLHGAKVHGYDRTETELTRALAAEGMTIHYVDDPAFIPVEGVDLAIYTPAVPNDHRELNYFLEKGQKVYKRAEVLGLISQSKKCVAIAGTHGKTTTSTMTAHLMRACGIDATAFVGGISLNLGSNFIEGKSDWVVVEADEYDRSFLHLYPTIAVINSIDADHLDIYGSEEEVRKSYEQFGNQVQQGGKLFISETAIQQGYRFPQGKLGDSHIFGMQQGDFRVNNLRVEDGQMVFDLDIYSQGFPRQFRNLRLNYPGHHNVANAVAAIGCTLAAGGDPALISAALADFKGVKRRFEYHVRTEKLVYVDDYAHHPAELTACISAARLLYPDRKITGIFQPHLYSRTRDFADAFAKALDLLDECWLLPIYPARELPIPGVDSELILSKMNLNNRKIIEKNELIHNIENSNLQVVLTMGAGDIDTFVQPIKTQLSAR